MPAGPIGTCWDSGTWPDTAWEEDSWADAESADASPDVIVVVPVDQSIVVIPA